ncbi:hypothetical protein ABKA04_001436 [Annulohypoxylon sp. FPYF3050]
MSPPHEVDDIHAESDYSCYITIRNLSYEDFGLCEFGIIGEYGKWPKGQPLNTIEAQTEPTVWLQDPKLLGGSEGWVIYEVPVGNKTETFKLQFCDPQSPWSSNYLKAESSDPESLVVSVQPYQNSGHPFYGDFPLPSCLGVVTVNVKSLKTASDGGQFPKAKQFDSTPQTSSNGPVHVNFDIGFDIPLIFHRPPIHESIVIAAFIGYNKRMPTGTTYNNLDNKQWEYMRGVVWNDDPSCYLFKDTSDDNHQFSNGIYWSLDFKKGNPDCMIQRSHYGDLQFLHSMASKEGEEPKETRRKVLKWLEVMYKLACGNQGVLENSQLKEHLGEWFTDTMKPSGQNTLRDLLLSSTPSYNHVDIHRRALGHCLHIIVDSYAIGHTQRILRNPESYQGRDSQGHLKFKPGTYGDWGSVKVFHCYGGQKTDKHSYYDGLQNSELPTPKELDTFNSILGARNAIDASRKLISYYADGINWEDGVQEFLATEVFGIDKDAKPANTDVDNYDPVS